MINTICSNSTICDNTLLVGYTPVVVNKGAVKFGTNDVKLRFGMKAVDKAYFGLSLMYENAIKLATPTNVVFTYPTLSFDSILNADFYGWYDGSTLVGTLPANEGEAIA